MASADRRCVSRTLTDPIGMVESTQPEGSLNRPNDYRDTMANRIPGIDAFRGLAIILMVFFTVTLKLSSDLPPLLKHNVRGQCYIGDIVLPMFLFASGMSLAYYLRKRENEGKKNNLKSVAGRFGKLALVGVSLSFFSAYGFLNMDEVMLCALLFLACLVLSKTGWKTALAVTFLINLSFLAVVEFGMLGIFSGHYLGGYAAVPFYLPVMLIGLIVGKNLEKEGIWSRNNLIIVGTIFGFFVIFLALIPLNKIPPSPSFIMPSILISFLLFSVLNTLSAKRDLKELEFIGRTPLRYWILMFVFFVIPARLYVESVERSFPMDLQWPFAIAMSMGLMVFLWGLNRILEERA